MVLCERSPWDAEPVHMPRSGQSRTGADGGGADSIVRRSWVRAPPALTCGFAATADFIWLQYWLESGSADLHAAGLGPCDACRGRAGLALKPGRPDRKSTRLNSSHLVI